MKRGLVILLYNFGKRFMGWTLHMIMCVLLCYPVSIRTYYQQGVLFLVAHTFFECETNQKDIMAWDLLMWSNLALYPSFQVGNTCSALVHCLYGGYNLHRFTDALGLVDIYVVLWFCVIFNLFTITVIIIYITIIVIFWNKMDVSSVTLL